MEREAMNNTFGIIRSLLTTPSPQTWKRLCGYLDRYEPYWHEPMIQQREMHYVRSQLSQWPAKVPRYAQHLWITRALTGKDVPQLEFATAIQLISQDAGPEQIEMLFHNPGLRNMRHIDLRAATLGYEGIMAILNYPWFEALEVLDLRRSHIAKEFRERLGEHLGTTCRVLYSA